MLTRTTRVENGSCGPFQLIQANPLTLELPIKLNYHHHFGIVKFHECFTNPRRAFYLLSPQNDENLKEKFFSIRNIEPTTRTISVINLYLSINFPFMDLV